MKLTPQIGIGVIVIKNNQILMGQRKNSHGDGCWSFPGGHLEFKELWETCAAREVLEETGVIIQNIRFVAITNDIFQLENKHYVTIFMISDYKSGLVKLLEPDKCTQWQWFDWGNLPNPLFLPVCNLLKQNYCPF